MANRWPRPAQDALFGAILALVGLALLELQGPPDNDRAHLVVALGGGLAAAVVVAWILKHPLLLPREERRLDTSWAIRGIVTCVWLLVASRTILSVTDPPNQVFIALVTLGAFAAAGIHGLVRRYGPKSSSEPASTGTTYRLAPVLIIALLAGALLAWHAANVAVGSVTFKPLQCGPEIGRLLCESFAPRMPTIDAWWSGVVVLSALAAFAVWLIGSVHGFMALLAGQMVVLAFWSEAAWNQMWAATPAGWEHAPIILLGQVAGSVLLLAAFYIGSAYRRTAKVHQQADHAVSRIAA